MTLAYLRDIAIILVALLSLVVGVLVAVLALQVYSLVRLVRSELKPILANARQTMEAVRGGGQAVGPPIQAARRIGAAVGLIRGLRSRLRGKGKKK